MINFKNRCGGVIASVLLAIISGIFGVLFSSGVYADDAPKTALTLSPMSQRIILTPGETYEGAIKVIDSTTSNMPMDYSARIGSFNSVRNEGGKDDYGASDLTNRSNYNIMMDWTTLENETGTLQPNESAILKFKIKVPKDAPAGAQYMTILVSDVTPDDSGAKEGAVNIESKVQMGSVVYATVAGATVEQGKITENSMPTILTNSKLEATSMVRNEGNIYTDASYTLQVWPLFSDEEICTNEESADSSMILPNTERYHIQSCDLPMVGIFKAKQVISIFGEQSVLEKTILVCPVWLMLVVLVIILAIIIAIVSIIKKHKKGVDNAD